MSLVLSSSLVLADAGGALGADNPVIGWHNVVAPAGIVADTQDANYPASNLANPATHLKWLAADTTEQYLTITTNEVEAIDYVAVAGHNWSSAEIPVSIENNDGAPVTIVDAVILPNNGPVLFRFEPQSIAEIRIKLQSGAAPAAAAAVYCGRLLVLPRKIWQDHTPIVHGRKSNVLTGRSESGNLLGRIVLNESTESHMLLRLIDPDFYRENIHDFILASKALPFFIAWRPETYPREVGYCWMMNDPVPVNAPPSGLIEIDLQMQGIV